ncbi:MAG: glycogen/starch synthase [Flavobacteriaceae bacterium]|nr:glycogen/starch synthase [Flavobacteriaceae bacterium]
MKDKRILYVSSEVVPYLPETEMSLTTFEVAKMVHNLGGQTRIFMPRFGLINERRHQLHEVIRLSGMNIVVDDMDMPLIIKVASIPKERMQVYFIDNDEYFKRKSIFSDEDDNLYTDNAERAIFFAKGVVETVKKLNWQPHIIHIHGWMSALLPLYLKTYFADEALFNESKIVTSIYNNGFEGSLDSKLFDKIRFDVPNEKKLITLNESTHFNMQKIAIENSDAVVYGSATIPAEIEQYIQQSNKKVLTYYPLDNMEDAITNFYLNQVLQ